MTVSLRQIEPIVADRLVELLGLLAGVLEHVVGKSLGQIEFANDRQRIDARIAASAEHFDDHAFAVVDVRGKADHLEHDFIVGPGVFRAGSPSRIGRTNSVPSTWAKRIAAGFEVGADELMRVALEHFDDLADRIGPPHIAMLLQAHEHGVAAGGVARAIGGDEDVELAIGARCWFPQAARSQSRPARGGTRRSHDWAAWPDAVSYRQSQQTRRACHPPLSPSPSGLRP